MKKNLIIYGTGTLGEIAGFYFQNDSDYNLIAYVNADELITSDHTSLNDLPILKWSEVLMLYPPLDVDIFVAIGYRKTNTLREKRYNEVKRAGYNCASYVSSKAINYSKFIGENCFILESNVLQPYVVIGSNTFLWSGNHIGHHSIINENVFITSHVVVSGKCIVGNNCFIGVNSLLHDGIVIGEKSIIGAGSLVVTSCPGRSVFNPNKTESRIINRDII